MPKFSKKSLSLFLRNGCEKQFVLSLYNKTERDFHKLPPAQANRSGLGLVGEAGYKWQDEKVSELKDVFGEANIHISPVFKGKRPAEIDLLGQLPNFEKFQFIVEGKYSADTAIFRNALSISEFKDYFGNAVSIGDTQPDIVQILPALNSDGEQFINENDAYELAVLPDGKTERLAKADNRLRLRVIDIKLTSEPGAHYYAEVVYYSMTLAAWLIENKLDDRFIVIAAPAVWAGSHEASNLVKQMTEWRKKFYAPTAAEMFTVLEEDLEIAPFEVFAAPLRRILTESLPAMLAQNWEDLSWHVDFRCKGCEFLGYPWLDKDGNIDNDSRQCYPTADRNAHLSQVVGLSRGATKHLSSFEIQTLEKLADTDPASQIFEEHQSLRAKRTIFPHRADALRKGSTFVIPRSNVLTNQILVATLNRLIRTNGLDTNLRSQIKNLLWRFDEVEPIELKNSIFSRVKLHRNNNFYGFILNLCHLIHENSLLSEKTGDWHFTDFLRDERKMNQLFETFLRNFYTIEQREFKVRRENIYWQFSSGDNQNLQFLPLMQTDITLENEDFKIIIDAKFYKETLKTNYGKEKINSANLYQIFSYLINQQEGDEKTCKTAGILLYPTIEQEYDLHFHFQQHPIFIKTVNLNNDWWIIEKRLKQIISNIVHA